MATITCHVVYLVTHENTVLIPQATCQLLLPIDALQKNAPNWAIRHECHGAIRFLLAICADRN